MDQVRERKAWMAVQGITPNSLMGPCGASLKDESQRLSESSFSRNWTHKGPVATVVIKFVANTDAAGQVIRTRTGFDDPEGVVKYDTDRSKVEALPCLAD